MQTSISKISPSIFRAYDIRGTVDETLTPDIVYTLGLAIGSEAKKQGEKKIIIARDGRLSGSELSKALSKGLCDSGCDVINIGAVPTPILYFATHILPTHSGVMLTGSHNPPNYNGLKIIIDGETLAEQKIYDLYQRILAKNFTSGEGRLQDTDVVSLYLSAITEDIKLQRKLRVVIDCGNGITGKVAPQLIKLLGCEVIELFCQVDGNFPNHHPDPSVPENLRNLIESVQINHADIGIAFDGDGDRLGVVDDNGKIIWPDRQMMLYAIDVLKENPGATILYDVKCTSYLEPLIREYNGKPLMWKTGHSLIKAKLYQTQALLAGEMSGHIFFNDRWYGFDDALYSAARLLEILAADNRPSSAIFADLPDSINTPELKLLMEEDRKFPFMEEFKNSAQFTDGKITTIDGVRVDFAYGFGLLRVSNTTPCLVFRFEADSEENLKQIQEVFRHQLLAIDTNLKLPF